MGSGKAAIVRESNVDFFVDRQDRHINKDLHALRTDLLRVSCDTSTSIHLDPTQYPLGIPSCDIHSKRENVSGTTACLFKLQRQLQY